MKLCTAILCCALMALAACAPRGGTDMRARFEPVAALPPASLGAELSLSQIVTGELAGEGQSMRFEIEVTEKRFSLAALSHAGIPLFTLVQSANDPDVRLRGPGAEIFDPVYLLSDIKLCYWPRERLNLALGPQRLRMDEGMQKGRRTRAVKDETGRTLLRIAYPASSAGEIVLRRYDMPYRLRIRPLGALAGEGA